MSIRHKAIRGSLLLTLGEGVVYGCSFVRNMFLARLLTKTDFGIAATLSLIVTLLEMSDKLGMARFVVSDVDGDKPDFIGAAHLMHFIVALASAGLILVATPLLGLLFRVPDQRREILLLAFIPVFKGLEHLDVRRFERTLRFAPSLVVEALAQIVITLAAWPVTRWLTDYRAILALLLAKSLVTCVGSHLLAEEPYRWRVQRPYMTRMLRFGWPLVINGFLMFGVLQGDQFIVAARYTMTDLAPYAAAASLALAPTFFFGRVFSSLLLPILADAQRNLPVFVHRYRRVMAIVTVFAVLYASGIIVAAEALMPLVYGAKYAGAGILLAWLAAANAFRNLRIAPALAALAKGDSQNQMVSNWWRTMSLIPAAALALWNRPLWMIACSGLLGEGLACCVSCYLLRKRDGVPLSVSLVPTGWVAATVAALGGLVALGIHRMSVPAALLLAATLGCVTAGATVAAMPDLRSEALRLWALKRDVGWRHCLRSLWATESLV